MQQPYLQLRERRELGTILSDSFTFIRINKAPLWKVLVKTCGVFFLLTVLFSGLYQYAAVSAWLATEPLSFVLVAGLMILGSILFYGSLTAAIYTFMQNYMDTKGNVQEELIIQNARAKTGTLVFLTIIPTIMLSFGFLFFVIPGIYFIVPITVVFPILCFERRGKMDSIKASFKLISGYWWITFGTVLVIAIVVGIISVAFQLPSSIYLGVKTFFSVSEGDGQLSGDFLYLILTTISAAASNLLSIVTVVCLGLVYFDLDEEKNKTGMKEKLENLG